MLARIKAFFQQETAGGIVLGLAAIAALVISNSPAEALYEAFVELPGEIRIGTDWLVLLGLKPQMSSLNTKGGIIRDHAGWRNPGLAKGGANDAIIRDFGV